MFKLQCPKCKNKMLYSPLQKKDLAKKQKRCVYCGHTFKVSSNIIDGLSA